MLFLALVFQLATHSFRQISIPGTTQCYDVTITLSGNIITSCCESITLKNQLTFHSLNGTFIKQFTWGQFTSQAMVAIALDPTQKGIYCAGSYFSGSQQYCQTGYAMLNGTIGYTVQFGTQSTSCTFWGIDYSQSVDLVVSAGQYRVSPTSMKGYVQGTYRNGTAIRSYFKIGPLDVLYNTVVLTSQNNIVASGYSTITGNWPQTVCTSLNASLGYVWEVTRQGGYFYSSQYIQSRNSVLVSGSTYIGNNGNILVIEFSAKNGSTGFLYTVSLVNDAWAVGVQYDLLTNLICIVVNQYYFDQNSNIQFALSSQMLLPLSANSSGVQPNVFGAAVYSYKAFLDTASRTYVATASNITSGMPVNFVDDQFFKIISASKPQTSTVSTSTASQKSSTVSISSSQLLQLSVSITYVEYVELASSIQTPTQAVHSTKTSIQVILATTLDQLNLVYTRQQVSQSNDDNIIASIVSKPIEGQNQVSMFNLYLIIAASGAGVVLILSLLIYLRRCTRRRKSGGNMSHEGLLTTNTIVLDQTIPLQQFTLVKMDQEDKFSNRLP